MTVNLEILVPYAPFVLILGGIVATSWLIRKLSEPTPVVGAPVSSAVKIISLFGFLVGVLMLITAAGVWLTQAYDSGTRLLLIATGLALVLKTLKDIPWAALMGLAVGGLCVAIVYILFPLSEAVLGVSPIWVYLAIFLIPALLAYLFFKFVEDLLKLAGMILGSRPIATILGIVCLLQGALLLLDMSLFSIILS